MRFLQFRKEINEDFIKLAIYVAEKIIKIVVKDRVYA